jgi:tetratricopeptide (TPR) repeat protein
MSDPADRGPRDNDRRPGGERPNTGRPTGARGDSSRPYKAKPPASGKPPFRDGKPPASRDGRPAPRDGEKRLWTKGGAPARGDRDARERETPEDRDPFGTRSVRSRHDDPIIPEGVTANELDRIARNELKTLSKENADGVALHLVLAARLIESDPALAHQHAISAARRAGRIGVVRETLAITAYATGDYALALRELRTYRRITGRNDQLPMMVDSERGLGRPEKALEEGRSVPRSSLSADVRVQLAIAMSGARLDLGQTDAALAELEIPELDPKTAFSYSPALFDAYATVLEELGRNQEAEDWFERSERASDALDQAESPGDVDVIEVVEIEDDQEEDDQDEDNQEEDNQYKGDEDQSDD